MIPKEIADLASALSDEFNIDFDQAVRAAYRIAIALADNGLHITKDPER
jgi:hypothetical protein